MKDLADELEERMVKAKAMCPNAPYFPFPMELAEKLLHALSRPIFVAPPLSDEALSSLRHAISNPVVHVARKPSISEEMAASSGQAFEALVESTRQQIEAMINTENPNVG